MTLGPSEIGKRLPKLLINLEKIYFKKHAGFNILGFFLQRYIKGEFQNLNKFSNYKKKLYCENVLGTHLTNIRI